MKVRVVGFQKTIGMPNFSNDRPLVVEADLEEGETMQEAWSKMNKAAIEWHEAEYPHLYGKVDTGMDLLKYMQESQPPASLPVISKDKERIEIEIDNVEDIESLKFIKQKYPLMPASCLTQYNKKLAELNSGRPQNFSDGLD